MFKNRVPIFIKVCTPQADADGQSQKTIESLRGKLAEANKENFQMQRETRLAKTESQKTVDSLREKLAEANKENSQALQEVAAAKRMLKEEKEQSAQHKPAVGEVSILAKELCTLLFHITTVVIKTDWFVLLVLGRSCMH